MVATKLTEDPYNLLSPLYVKPHVVRLEDKLFSMAYMILHNMAPANNTAYTQ